MSSAVSRRSFLQASAPGAAPLFSSGAAGQPAKPSNIKLGFSTGLNEDFLRFMKQLGIEWIATSLRATQGASLSEHITRGAVLTSVDGALAGC